MTERPRKSLFWIASYPKSGNTWMRAFLANYLLGGNDPLPLEQIRSLGFADADASAYAATHGGPFDLADPRKTVELRQRVFERLNTQGPNVSLIKTHCYHGQIDGVPLIPTEFTRGALYIVRHPGDVAVSFASHFGLSLDQAIDRMAQPRAVIGGSGNTAMQFTADWSTNLRSWAEAKDMSVKVIRYEDMQAMPEKVFKAALRHVGVSIDDAKLARAIKHSDFDALQSQEAASGFAENSQHQENFFRSGGSGGWKNVLSQAQIDRLRQAHWQLMDHLMYD